MMMMMMTIMSSLLLPLHHVKLGHQKALSLSLARSVKKAGQSSVSRGR
jgi:hypothetical protein